MPTIACIGGTTLDRRARAHSPLITGTSNPATVTTKPGGVARNVADWLSQLGVDVALYSALGDDRAGYDLLRQLATNGVDVSGVRRSADLPTATYTAALEPNGELTLGLADMEIFERLDADWCDSIAPAIEQCPIWLVDANLPRATLDYLLNTYGDNATIVADPVSVAKAERLRPYLDAVDVVFPDRKEAAVLSGLLTETPEQVAAAAAQIWDLGPGTVIVSLGAEGIYLEDGTRHQAIPCDSGHAGERCHRGGRRPRRRISLRPRDRPRRPRQMRPGRGKPGARGECRPGRWNDGGCADGKSEE